ncbi:hypothetical protein C2E20_5568 [Micractinium conductrix]|uniref:Uncharacterized protein n=1 Tax=Micractinium conductrix TaxID=554055 RepID=A0A2P6VAL1_9CHLO|nr:hypothetical protein C2E20_5568 [Micractinium conductrix]|eukprot:PSC71127.1 hypothetical protein C2E20_5568 [Micractinium conductrix]
MNFLKRFFGWGGEEDAGSDERARVEQQQQRLARQRAAAAAVAAQWGRSDAPLVAEAPSGDGGVQGLDWFSKSMLRDSDGDCAHSFLEEASQQQQQRRQQQGGAACTRSQQQPRSGGGKQAKQQAALQCKSRGAQSAGPSDLLLDSGNVYVVPHDS